MKNFINYKMILEENSSEDSISRIVSKGMKDYNKNLEEMKEITIID